MRVQRHQFKDMARELLAANLANTEQFVSGEDSAKFMKEILDYLVENNNFTCKGLVVENLLGTKTFQDASTVTEFIAAIEKFYLEDNAF